MSEATSSVDFDTNGWSVHAGNFAGDNFFTSVTGSAADAAAFAKDWMVGAGFQFFAALLLFVVVSLAIWRRITKGV